MNEWAIVELNVQTDHVHLLIQLPPKEAVAHAVQLMKGGTSRKIREEYPELEEFLWDDSLWVDGYFVESVGQVTEALSFSPGSVSLLVFKRGALYLTCFYYQPWSFCWHGVKEYFYIRYNYLPNVLFL